MQRSSGPSPFVIIVVLAIGGIGVGLVLINRPAKAKAPPRNDVVTPEQPSVAGHSAPPDGEPASRVANHHRGPGVPHPADPESYTRNLVASLTNVDLSTGRLSPEQTDQVRQSFQALVAQGSTAVPLIKALLDEKKDVSYGKGSGDTIGAPSLRTGLLETLRQIGGPEAIAVSQQVLQTTSDPLEIALVTRNLEEAAPGQYRQDSLKAVLATLNAAAQGQLGSADVGPLFQALQSYGDAHALDALTSLGSKYGYYASLALAGLPSGQGVSALAQMAQDTSETGTGNRQFALQMLAQVASRYPDANSTLVDLSRQNQVPDTAWNSIAAVLGGQQYQFTRQYPENMFSTLNGPDLQTHRQQNGNQNFISTVLPADGSAPDVTQRLAIIDQLLAATSNPAAIQALQQAKARLGGIPGSK